MPVHGRPRGDPPDQSPTADGRRGSLVLTTFDLDEYVYAALRAGRQRLPAQGRPAERAARRRSGSWPPATRCSRRRHPPADRASSPRRPGARRPPHRRLTRSPTASARCWPLVAAGCPTRRSPRELFVSERRSRPTSAGCSPSWGPGPGQLVVIAYDTAVSWRPPPEGGEAGSRLRPIPAGAPFLTLEPSDPLPDVPGHGCPPP